MYPIEKYKFKEFSKTNSDGSNTKVVAAISTYRGKPIKGVAKCTQTDEYSFENGKKLSAARCNLKVCVKRKNDLLKKKAEVGKRLVALNDYYIKVCNQVGLATVAAIEAEAHLESIENELK